MRLKVYIAGPMTGYDDFNFPAFYAAAEAWRAAGWDVVNPAELNTHLGLNSPWENYIARDLGELALCHAVAFLPGSDESRGAKLERLVAEYMNKRIFDAQHPARHPITDHPFRESAHEPCCDLPDYCHMEGWFNQHAA